MNECHQPSTRPRDRPVDTSVWIRVLSNRNPAKGGRQQRLADDEQMRQAPVVPHRDVVEFVRERRLHGRGIGWIDAHLLASALVGRLRLWTTDPAWATAAKELGVAYE